MIRALVTGLILGAMATLTLQYYTQQQLDVCNAQLDEAQATLTSF